MFRLTKTWTERVRVLAVLGLMALVGVSCVNGGVQAELAELRCTVDCIESRVNAAQQRANEALEVAQSASAMDTPVEGEEELAELRGKLADIESRVDAAQQTADEALTLAQSASVMGTPVEGEPVLLASGIALAYEHEGEQELVTYPVDAVSVFYTYENFESKWKNRSDIIVQLAWTAGGEERTWQLEFADQVLVPGDPGVRLSDVNRTDWHEYRVYTPIGIPADTEPDLSSVVVEHGDRQSIVDSKKVGTDPVAFQLLGESDDEGRPYIQFLLRDQTPGQVEHTIEYTLVIILEPLFELPGPPPSLVEDPPDPRDSAGQRHCTACVFGVCISTCR